MSELMQIFLLALLGSVIALLGGVVFLFSKRLSSFLEEHSVPFAAGVLLTVALIGLLPEAVHFLGEASYIYVLVSFIVAFLFEQVFFRVHHHHSHHDNSIHEGAIPLIIFGDTIHNFIDGVAIAAGFLVNPGLGLVTAISTFLHEVPHEISDFGIMLKVGWKRRDVLIVNFFSAMATIVGAFFVVFFLRGSHATGALLAISSGLFLYLGASDFVPHIQTGSKRPLLAILPFLLGVGVMIATLTAIPHTHDTEHSHAEEVNQDTHLHEEEHESEDTHLDNED